MLMVRADPWPDEHTLPPALALDGLLGEQSSRPSTTRAASSRLECYIWLAMRKWSRRRWSGALVLGGATLPLLPRSAQACGYPWALHDAELGPAGLKSGCLQLFVDEQRTRRRGPRANVYKISGPAAHRYIFESDGWSPEPSQRLFSLRGDLLSQADARVGQLEGNLLRLQSGASELQFELQIPPTQGERELRIVHQGRVVTRIEATQWCDMEPASVRTSLALLCAWRTFRWPELASTLAP